MQDSLEDYIKISRNCKEEEPITIKKEVQLTAIRKKECDVRAMKIVEFSIEGKLRPEIFTRCLPYINQSHYQDIVEERAITKLCGYSLCGKRIPNMPQKQYFISTKSNKVYDITDRKNYCSNFCYKASLHIKKQIDDSPLWLRKLDDIPEYQLLESSEAGLPGEYIDQGIAKPVAEPTFTPVSMFTDFSLDNMIKNEVGRENLKDKKFTRKGTHQKSTRLMKNVMQTIKENAEQIEEEEAVSIASTASTTNKKNVHKKHEHPSPTLPVIEEKEERFETKCEENDDSIKENSDSPVKPKKQKKKCSKPTKLDVEQILMRVLKEWLTLETYIFLYGETKVKQILDEKKLSDYFERLNVAELQRHQQAKYMDICRKLQMQEMADEKFDRALLGNTKLKPVPDYKKLKEESKDLNVKVKSFYSGVLYEKEDSNFPTKVNKKDEESKEEEPPVVLPLADVNSQNALRRKIFVTSLNKAIHHLLRAFRAQNITPVLSDIQNLVKTFRLKADNIVFKPAVWEYIALVLLNMLSIQNEDVRAIIQDKASKEYTEVLLSNLNNKSDFISDIMTNIENIDLFVENYVSSST